MPIKRLCLQHEILGILWNRRDEHLENGMLIRFSAEVIGDKLNIYVAEASRLLGELDLRGLVHRRRGSGWEYNYIEKGVHAYRHELLLKEAYLIYRENMNYTDLEECDAILRYFWERRGDDVLFIWREVYEALKMERYKANLHYQTLNDDGYLDSPTKGIGGIDGHSVEITKEGRQFFSKSSYVEDYKKRNNAESDTAAVTYNIHVGSNTGNVIVDSHFKDAIITLTNENADAAKYLETIKEIIESTNNDDAHHLFDKLNEELAKPKKDSRMINFLWKGIETTIPHTPAIIEAGHKLLSSLNI